MPPQEPTSIYIAKASTTQSEEGHFAIMGTSLRSRTRQSSGLRKGPLKSAREVDSRRSTHNTSLASSAKPPSPALSTLPEQEATLRTARHDSAGTGSEDIAPEIVVWTEDMDSMMVDSPETPASATSAHEDKTTYVYSSFPLSYCHSVFISPTYMFPFILS
jgi:hypothetical protein